MILINPVTKSFSPHHLRGDGDDEYISILLEYRANNGNRCDGNRVKDRIVRNTERKIDEENV